MMKSSKSEILTSSRRTSDISGLNVRMKNLKLEKPPGVRLSEELKWKFLSNLAEDKRLAVLAVEQSSKRVKSSLERIASENPFNSSVVEQSTKLLKAIEYEEYEEYLMSIGYAFSPEEGLLVHHYLREKCMNGSLSFARINESNIYKEHPAKLTENCFSSGNNVWYYWVGGCVNQTRGGKNVQEHWILGKECDVFYVGKKVGEKRLLQYSDSLTWIVRPKI